MTDARLSAFLRSPVEVFHSVAAISALWKHDPLDVRELHRDARAAFEKLVQRAIARPVSSGGDSQDGEPGRVLLMTGAAGCGKTHLLRSFRNMVHVDGRAFVGYMQLTTASSNFVRYILTNLVDSFSQPYYDEFGDQTTGLMQLARVLVRNCENELLEELLFNSLDHEPGEVNQAIEQALEILGRQPRYRNIDPNLLRVLLFLHRQDQLTTMRVMRYLRCEPLTPADSRALNDVLPNLTDEAPEQMLVQLGTLVRSTERALVVCIDQLEGVIDEQVPPEVFRRLMQTICNLAGQISSSVFVVACLSDLYDQMRSTLTQSLLDRIEVDPRRVRLKETCTADEAELIVAARLQHLYERANVPFDPADPLYPFQREEVRALAGRLSRSIVAACLKYRQQAQEEGKLPAHLSSEEPASASARDAGPRDLRPAQGGELSAVAIEQKWNDFLAAWSAKAVPLEDEEQAELVAWALGSTATELGGTTASSRLDVSRFEVVWNGIGAGLERLIVEVCNLDPRGGRLGQRVDALQTAARDTAAVLARTTDFPSGTRSETARKLDAFKNRPSGGRCVVVQEADLRAMQALRAFEQAHGASAGAGEWRATHRPLLRLPAIQAMIGRAASQPGQVQLPLGAPSSRPVSSTSTTAPPQPLAATTRGQPQGARSSEPPATRTTSAATVPSPAPAAVHATEVVAGQLQGAKPGPVVVSVDGFRYHAAIIGTTGYGKTTLALGLIEQLLLAGVPAILVDRKGDMAVYADPSKWPQDSNDQTLVERRRLLQERLDVAVFTPGHPRGRTLSISPLPSRPGELAADERRLQVEASAAALAGLLKLKDSQRDNAMRALLLKATELLAEVRPESMELSSLLELVQSRDPVLVDAAKPIEEAAYARLVQSLGALRINAESLLEAEGERLDPELLLGLGAHARPGKTRLSVVSTKFLSDPDAVQLWVSQFLLSLSRWAGRQAAGPLRAVVMFDEADQYLPATSKPPTKKPMEDLLRRSRSAGLGVILATQNPGDFDYACRDQVNSWFIGRVKEKTALEKLRPMLGDSAARALERIPQQGVGEFYLAASARVTPLRGQRSAVDARQANEADLLRLAAGTKAGAPKAAVGR